MNADEAILRWFLARHQKDWDPATHIDVDKVIRQADLEKCRVTFGLEDAGGCPTCSYVYTAAKARLTTNRPTRQQDSRGPRGRPWNGKRTVELEIDLGGEVDMAEILREIQEVAG